jgi:broad specificity phosphatase PhoE
MKGNNLILVRHSYDDHSYIDGNNNTSLTSKGIEIAKQASEVILPKVNSNNVIIRYSVKARAKETADILCERLLRENINCQCIPDNGLTELFQGKFNFDGMEHIDRVNFLQSCWDDFEGCRKQGDLSHHFGQNKDRNVILTPGENHFEWSIRIANGVLNILSDLENSYQSISITHRGALLEIQNLIKMLNGDIPINQVEQYVTTWMEYCQDYIVDINDLEIAKTLTKKYINKRSKNENNR